MYVVYLMTNRFCYWTVGLVGVSNVDLIFLDLFFHCGQRHVMQGHSKKDIQISFNLPKQVISFIHIF
jgi:hypothetical protein